MVGINYICRQVGIYHSGSPVKLDACRLTSSHFAHTHLAYRLGLIITIMILTITVKLEQNLGH